MAIKKLLGDIIARITADSSGFVSGVDRAKQSSRGLSSALKGATPIIKGFTAAFGVGAINDFVNQQLSAIDASAKFAKRIKSTTDEVERLHFIASQSGISLTNMDTAMQRIVRRTGDAQNGSKALVEAFQALNINVDQFSKLGATDKLRALSQAFENADDHGRAMAEMMKITDTEGLALVQSFGEQGAAIDALSSWYQGLGMTITETHASNVAAVQDGWGKVTTVWDKATKFLVAEMAPSMAKAMEFIADVSIRAVGAIRVAWNTLQKVVRISIKGIVDAAGFLFRMLAKLPGSVGRSYEALAKTMKGMSESIRRDLEEDNMDMAKGFELAVGGMEHVAKNADLTIGTGPKFEGFDDSMMDQFRKERKAPKEKKKKKEGDLEAEAEARRAKALEDFIRDVHKSNDALGVQLGIFDEGALKLRDFIEEHEGLTEQQISAARDAIEISEAQRKEWETQLEQMEAMKEMGAEFGEVMGDAFSGMLDGSKSLGDAIDDLSNRIMNMLTRVLIEKPLQGFFEGVFSGAAGGGGFLGDIMGGLFGKRAGGGSSFRPFLAGENGPELVLPGASGANVVSNGELSGGQAVNITMNVSTPDANSFSSPRARAQIEGNMRRAASMGNRSRAM